MNSNIFIQTYSSKEIVDNETNEPKVVTIFQENPILLKIKDSSFIKSYKWTSLENQYETMDDKPFLFYPNKVGIFKFELKTINEQNEINTSNAFIQVLPNIQITKNTYIVYYTNEVTITVSGGTTYSWEAINKSKYLPDSCYPTFSTETIQFTPERDLTYKVTASDGLGNESIGYIEIKVIPKPLEIIDTDIIPIVLYDEVINRRKKNIITILKQNNMLLKQLTEFYNITLQSAYKMEFQAKQGRGCRIGWITKYQIDNNKDYMMLSFSQQYQFLRYLLTHPNSNFGYLINIVQYSFVLPPPCQNTNKYFL